MTDANRCPALLISAPASGQGKTTTAAALARLYRDRGLRVRAFKTGPDFLDPMILEQASGAPCYQLDLFMGGEDHCRRLLADAARQADVILIEGVMGLFDGRPSSADLAALFGVPVLAVIDASAMAQTFAAVAHGLASFRDDVAVYGVIANRVGGARHAAMLSPPDHAGPPLLGALPRDAEVELPSRHLGLLQSQEIEDLDQRLSVAAARLGESFDAALPPAVAFETASDHAAPPLAGERPLAGQRIAVARDEAFAFLYPANLELLAEMGATLDFFSPLHDAEPPEADALYLPGGYPELHLDRLAANESMRESIQRHYRAGRPTVAECGGMLYLLDTLTDVEGRKAAMTGTMPGRAVMQPRLAALALQTVSLPEGELRGHTFHHSRMETPLPPIARGRCPNGKPVAEPVYRIAGLTASYIHFYFPSNPAAAARLFKP